MQASLDKRERIASLGVASADTSGVVMRWHDVEKFLTSYQAKGRDPDTVKAYRRALTRLYDMLPLGKRIYRDTLTHWRDELLADGYSNSSINSLITACNQFLLFIGKREYQLVGQLPKEDLQPELTRTEYKRLLSAAKLLDDERGYCLVKIFVCTGINVHELAYFTVENVTAGRFATVYKNSSRTVRISPVLQQELLAYANRNNITAGPLFLTKSGSPLNRTYVTHITSVLSQAAQVPKEKCTPRCLRKFYLTTRADIESNIEFLVEQAMDRQLEQEQPAAEW